MCLSTFAGIFIEPLKMTPEHISLPPTVTVEAVASLSEDENYHPLLGKATVGHSRLGTIPKAAAQGLSHSQELGQRVWVTTQA